jgi:transketolase
MQSMRDAFGNGLVALAEKRNDFVVLDADVAGGTGCAVFRDRFPERFIQCGIAEQNMFSMAAGLASSGIIPVVTCYAFAALRAMEQIRNSIAYPQFPVKIAVSHLGLDVGPDGATHQAVEDVAVFRSIPNLRVYSPADPVELTALLPQILDGPGPVYLRTGRSPLENVFSEDETFSLNVAKQIRDGHDAAIFAVGIMVGRAVKAAAALEQKGISCRVVDMACLKPLDERAVEAAARECGAIVTCEDHNKIGGLGGAVSEALCQAQPVPLEMVALDDCYGMSGEPSDLAELYHIMPVDIEAAVMRVLERKK